MHNLESAGGGRRVSPPQLDRKEEDAVRLQIRRSRREKTNFEGPFDEEGR